MSFFARENVFLDEVPSSLPPIKGIEHHIGLIQRGADFKVVKISELDLKMEAESIFEVEPASENQNRLGQSRRID
ncbi:hypothetical protein CR513_50767, partial [Mucuna pruriens]